MHMSFLAATYSSILLHGDVVLVVSVTSAVEQDGADHAIYKKLCSLKIMSVTHKSLPSAVVIQYCTW